jgi:CubicO group peptidase (beta-lactamase class C family)
MRFRGASVVAAAAMAATLAAHAQPDRQSAPPQLAPPYVPEGTPQEQGLAGYAKILCSAVFVQGRDPVEGATNSAYWMAQNNQVPLDQITYRVHRATKTVTATFGTITRWARYYGDQGCVLPAHGRNDIAFTPVPVKTTLPDAMTQAWPMGDQVDTTPLPAEVDKARLDAAVDAAFADPAALTAGFIVVYKGHIIAECYGAGADKDTQLESWSMGKSIASTLFALLVKDGTYTLDQPAPVALWQKPGDPRAKIRNRDLLQMSEGK